MKKTLDDYLNAPDLANEPSALREVHAIRLMIHGEIKDMTTSERTAYYNGNTAEQTPSPHTGRTKFTD